MSAHAMSRFPLRRLILPMLLAVYLGYFGYHAFTGTYGIRGKEGFDAEAAVLRAELAELQAETTAYERRAALLRPQSLDPDMIDERARRSLNVIGATDVVIIP
jgi:cell division protein FtsB